MIHIYRSAIIALTPVSDPSSVNSATKCLALKKTFRSIGGFILKSVPTNAKFVVELLNIAESFTDICEFIPASDLTSAMCAAKRLFNRVK